MMRYIIEASYEPRGEGNGWEECEEHKAKLFFVWKICSDDEEECIGGFNSKEDANAFIMANKDKTQEQRQ